MITNERQYRISKRKLRELRVGTEGFNREAVAGRVGSEILAAAELEALRSEVEILSDAIRDYEDLKSGGVTTLEAASLEELPVMLIRARIARGISQRRLAELVGVKEQQIQRYESEKYSTASLRRLQEVAGALSLKIRESAEVAGESLPRRAEGVESPDWNMFPVREMYGRGWFEGFSGSVDDAVRNTESLVRDYVTGILRKPAVAFHRRRVRSGSPIDEYSLLAWECRVIELASRANVPVRYRPDLLSVEWMGELARISAARDGPARVRAVLRDVGIPFVVEPHLAKTRLDGAAILRGRMPVIGLTLRYDRLDNFWFVLFHELFHVVKHIRKGTIEGVFDDLDAVDDGKNEVEADRLAGDALVPEEAWNRDLARFVRTRESVEILAARLGISSAIVAGRIRHEARNYVILNELIGQGEVRKHFPDVSFGT